MKYIRIVFISIITVLVIINISVFTFQAYHKQISSQYLINKINPDNVLFYATGNIQDILTLPAIRETKIIKDNQIKFSAFLQNNTLHSTHKEIALLSDNNHNLHMIIYIDFHLKGEGNIGDSWIYKETENGTIITTTEKSLEYFLNNQQDKTDPNLRQQIITYSSSNITAYINYQNIFQNLIYNFEYSPYNITFYPIMLSDIFSEFKNSTYTIDNNSSNIHIHSYSDYNTINTPADKFTLNSSIDWRKFMDDQDQLIIKSKNLAQTYQSYINDSHIDEILSLDLNIIFNAIESSYNIDIPSFISAIDNNYILIQSHTGEIAFITDSFSQTGEDLLTIQENIKNSLPYLYPHLEETILIDGTIQKVITSNIDKLEKHTETYKAGEITYYIIPETRDTFTFTNYNGITILTPSLDFAHTIIDRYTSNNLPDFISDLDIKYQDYLYINPLYLENNALWIFGEYMSLVKDFYNSVDYFIYGKTTSPTEVFAETFIKLK